VSGRPTRARSSRARYRLFVDDYHHGRLDEATHAPNGRKSPAAATSDASSAPGAPRKVQRQMESAAHEGDEVWR